VCGEREVSHTLQALANLDLPRTCMGQRYAHYFGPEKCRTEIMADRSEAQVLTDPDRLEVHWSRPDGSYVFVIADSTFRNNSLTPSQAALPTLDQLKAFVMDPRLVLP
jgi:hypothetical protein